MDNSGEGDKVIINEIRKQCVRLVLIGFSFSLVAGLMAASGFRTYYILYLFSIIQF